MHHRSTFLAITTAALMSLAVAPSAQAKTITESIDRTLFDATPQRTAAVLHLDGATNGELGGAMDLTVTATDGTLPTTFGTCEPVQVDAVVTVSPGRVLTVRALGEGCAHIVDGTLQVNAFFGSKGITCEGCATRKLKVVGDGLVAASHSQLGGLATFSGVFR
jgi:hypothetical protein